MTEDNSRITLQAELCLEAETEAAPMEASDTTQAAAASGEASSLKLSRFRMVAYTGAAMRLAGWRYPVIIDLAGLVIPSQRLPIRYSHDSFHGVGHTESIVVEGGQLIASGVITVSYTHLTLPTIYSV